MFVVKSFRIKTLLFFYLKPNDSWYNRYRQLGLKRQNFQNRSQLVQCLRQQTDGTNETNTLPLSAHMRRTGPSVISVSLFTGQKPTNNLYVRTQPFFSVSRTLQSLCKPMCSLVLKAILYVQHTYTEILHEENNREIFSAFRSFK